MPSTSAKMTSLLDQVAREYPAAMVPGQVEDIPRIQFHLEYILRAFTPRAAEELTLGDLGGGIGLFSVGQCGCRFQAGGAH